ncbi:hypothetical protein [Streptomyces sp. NPDC053542]|uniref:hypothetical protein n=1 Tax=Streptomyces sp. NPDC053542 TaxID=3365710 RepID=UPI0037D38E7D
MGKRRSIRTTGLLLTAAFALLAGGTQAASAGTGETNGTSTVGAANASQSAASDHGPRVKGQVTRLVFKTPRTLDELRSELSGLTVLQLRYTGDVGGVSQSGPGSSVTEAVKDLRRDTVKRWGAEPLVYMAVVDGKLPSTTAHTLSAAGATVKHFASDTRKIDQLPKGTLADATRATRERTAELARQGVPVPDPKRGSRGADRAERGQGEPAAAAAGKEFAWSPVYAAMQAWHYSGGPEDQPKTFNHQMEWGSASDIEAFGQDFGYEHNVSLYNEDDIAGRPWTRPGCAPWDSAVADEYQNFWAAWDIWAFKWNAVSYGWNIPGEAAPYWDWDDVTDECSKLDFTMGIGYPMELKPNVEYGAWIYAEDGDQDFSVFDMGGQKLSNDCNNLGMDPGSSCMGLNDNRPGTGTELIVNKTRGWTVPGCIGWFDGTPFRSKNGEGGCPANDA